MSYPPGVDRAILVRHGESTASAKGLLNGDPYHYYALTRAGRRQAKALGERLRDEPIDLCVTSRFPRTRETADIALEGRPIPRLVVPDLDDVRVGEFEGRPVEDLRLWQRTHPLTDPIPGGGESRVDSIARYCAAYQSLLASAEANLLVVAHGLPITAALLAIQGQDVPETLQGVQVAYAEPHAVSASELSGAVRFLREWVRRTSAGGPQPSSHDAPAHPPDAERDEAGREQEEDP